MTTRETQDEKVNEFKNIRRKQHLMPNGVPRYVRCYDNGGQDAPNGSADRYTVCFTGRAATERHSDVPHYPYLVMNNAPFHPQGIGMHCSNPCQPCDTTKKGKQGWAWAPAVGRKHHVLGLRIPFQQLPKDCQKAVVTDYLYFWNLV